jgi:predicted secreted protein
MKKVLCGIIVLAASLCTFAGDAAAFVDVGISSDGKTYIFGEYGRTDNDFQGYAEIYTVDIAKNDFVSGGVFKTEPSVATSSKSGKTVYDELLEKAGWAVRKYECKPALPENLLYIRDERVNDGTEIVFKDFEGSSTEQSVFYHLKVNSCTEGSGTSVRSSFSITLEKKNEKGELISRNIVGNPSVKRKGVSSYKIDRVISDKSGRNLVFIIEKQVKDKNGTSIRYMVETIRL